MCLSITSGIVVVGNRIRRVGNDQRTKRVSGSIEIGVLDAVTRPLVRYPVLARIND